MILAISKWTSHHNQIIYSLFYYCKIKDLPFSVQYNPDINGNGAVLSFENKQCFLDYSDSPVLIDNPRHFDVYFKRSLLRKNYINNIYPLNFQVNFSFKVLNLLTRLSKEIILNKESRVEIIRALDYFNIITNDSHRSKDLEKIWGGEITDNEGRIIFMTRLWDPDRNSNELEKERRRLQNDFRINACRIISKKFKNSVVGVYPDYFAKRVARDVLLDFKQTKKSNYLKILKESDICIADDGLKDTPGWKIGEYVMLNKAIISTPINTVVEKFYPNNNYTSLKNRLDYKSLPDQVNKLLKNKSYLDMMESNKNWSSLYLHPQAYVQNILDKMS